MALWQHGYINQRSTSIRLTRHCENNVIKASRVGWAAKPNACDGKKPLGFAAQPNAMDSTLPTTAS
jgi:hypothetical protein